MSEGGAAVALGGDWLALGGGLFVRSVLDFVPTRAFLEHWLCASRPLYAALQVPAVCEPWRWDALAPPAYANGQTHGWTLHHPALGELGAPARLRVAHCFRQGLERQEAKDPISALRWYTEALGLAPSHDMLMTRLADVLVSLDATAARGGARGLHESPFHSRAKMLYQKALRLDASNSYAMTGLALFEPDAEPMLRAALDLNPDNSHALSSLGDKLAATPEGNAEAIELLAHALSLNPRLQKARVALLQALWYRGTDPCHDLRERLTMEEECSAEFLAQILQDL